MESPGETKTVSRQAGLKVRYETYMLVSTEASGVVEQVPDRNVFINHALKAGKSIIDVYATTHFILPSRMTADLMCSCLIT